MTQGRRLSYTVITPAHNEARNLAGLAACLERQSAPPDAWVIVENGSDDQTAEVAARLARALPWVRLLDLGGDGRAARGGPVVRAFAAGVASLDRLPEVIVKLDADVSFEPDYFERLLAAFAAKPRLGVASGLCHEEREGAWRPLYGTRAHVWGACRLYRRECLEEVSPLEERQGWDEIDAIKAQLCGWSVGTIFDAAFRHHRSEGRRDGGYRRWRDQGDTAHYMGYRVSYLLVRSAYKALREPAALAMVWGYTSAALRREPRLEDEGARAFLRRRQRIRELTLRAHEALGKTG